MSLESAPLACRYSIRIRFRGCVLLLGIALLSGIYWCIMHWFASNAAPDEFAMKPAPDRDHAIARIDLSNHGRGDPSDAPPPGTVARFGTIRLRHDGEAWSLSFSRDSRYLISGGLVPMHGDAERAIRIWEVSSGKLLKQFGCQLGGVGSVALSHDGAILASVGLDDTICLWDVRNGLLRAQFQREPNADGNLISIAFSPDDRSLASIGAGDQIRLWDVNTGIQSSRFGVGGGAIAFGPDGSTLCDGCHLWDTATGKSRATFGCTPGGFNSVAFSSSGQFLAIGAADSKLHVFEARDGKEIAVYNCRGDMINAVAFAPAGNLLAAGCEDGIVRIYDLINGKELRRLEGHQNPVYAVAFSHDGKRLATAGMDHMIKIWQVASGIEAPAFDGHLNMVTCVAFSAEGGILASGGCDGRIHLWDPNALSHVSEIRGNKGMIAALAFAPTGRLLATADWNGGIELRDAASGKELRRLVGHRTSVPSIAFSPDGTMLASAGGDATCRLWELASAKEIWRVSYRGVMGGVAPYVAFSPDGRLLACGGEDTVIHLWDWSKDREVTRLIGSEASVNSVAFLPGGGRIVSAGADGSIRLWEVRTGREILRWHAHDIGVRLVACSPTGRLIASVGTLDARIMLWEVATGQSVVELAGHREEVLAVAFAPNGQRLASGSRDRTILLWDLIEVARQRTSQNARAAADGLDHLWEQFGDGNARRAFEAVWRVMSLPGGGVAFLAERLLPVPSVTPDYIDGLVAQLNSEDYIVRSRANSALERVGDACAPALRRALLNPPSVKFRRHASAILNSLASPVPPAAQLQTLRALIVLEHAGTREAKEVLNRLATGAPCARLTQEAKGSLQWLANRPWGHSE